VARACPNESHSRARASVDATSPPAAAALCFRHRRHLRIFSRRHCSRPPPSPLPTPLKLCGPPTGLANAKTESGPFFASLALTNERPVALRHGALSTSNPRTGGHGGGIRRGTKRTGGNNGRIGAGRKAGGTQHPDDARGHLVAPCSYQRLAPPSSLLFSIK
jgi:hypothetical protein